MDKQTDFNLALVNSIVSKMGGGSSPQLEKQIEKLTKKFSSVESIRDILAGSFFVNAPKSANAEYKIPGIFSTNFKKIIEKLDSFERKLPLTSVKADSNSKQENAKKQKEPIAEQVSEPVDILPDLVSAQPVLIEAFQPTALEGLENSLLSVLPKALKEGLKDLEKTLKKMSSEIVKATEESGSDGGGIIDTVLGALGLKSLFGGGVGGKPGGKLGGKPGASPATKSKFKGGGLFPALAGLATAGAASWATGKMLGKQEDFQKVDPTDLKEYAEYAKQTGDKEKSDKGKWQIEAQKKEVKIEAAQTVAGQAGYVAGAVVAKKLVASQAATRIWSVFLNYVKRKAPQLFAKLGARLLASAGLAAIPVVGWIGAAVNIGFTLWTAWDLYQLWKEFQALSDVERAYYADDKNSKPLPDDKLPKVDETTTAPKTRGEAAAKRDAKTEAPKPVEAATKPINVDEGLMAYAASPESDKLFEGFDDIRQEMVQKRESKKQEVEEKIKQIKHATEEEKLQLMSFEEAMGSKENLEKHKIRSERILKYESEQRRLEKELQKTNEFLEKQEAKPKLAKGGVVTPTPGGRDVTVAEGGQAEAVIPLDKFFKNDESLKEAKLTNNKLDGLIGGVFALAEAIKAMGVDISQRPPVVVNNTEQKLSQKTESKFAGVAQHVASMSSPARSYNANFAESMRPIRM